jgi:O-antigen/teichoic acid export membrane protein
VTVAGRLARHTGTNALHGLVAAACGIVIAGLMFRRLGTEYGIAALVTNGMIQLNLFEEGVGTFVVTEVSRQVRGVTGAGWSDEELRRLGAAMSTYLLGTVALAPVFGGAVWWLLAGRPDAVVLGLCGGVGLAAICLASLITKLLEGREDYVLLRLSQSGVNFLRVAGVVVLFVLESRSIVAYVAWFVLTYVLLALVVARHAYDLIPGGLLRAARSAGPQDYRRMGRYARPLMLAKGAAVVSYRLDLWIVQTLAGPVASTAYAMADALSSLAVRAIDAFRAGLLPVSVSSWREDDRGWVRDFALRTSKASVMLVGSVCVAMAAALDPLLVLWFGEAPPTALISARLLLLFVALTAFRSALQAILAGQHQFDRLQAHFLIAALLNFMISVTATAAWGGWGAALGTALAGVYLLAASLHAASHALQLPQGLLARRLVLPGLFALACGIAAGGLAHFGGPTWMQAMTRGFVAAGTFAAVAWRQLLAADERAWVLSVAAGRLRK